MFGDLSKHAPVGQARIAEIDERGDGVEVTIVGPGETVSVSGAVAGGSDRMLSVESSTGPLPLDRRDGRWRVAVPVGDRPERIRLSLTGGAEDQR